MPIYFAFRLSQS